MSIIREKVDHFLFKFSYSIKIKSIIFAAAFAAAFIAIMLIWSQFTLSQSIKKQIFGLNYQQHLGVLLEKTLLHSVYSHQKYILTSSLAVSKQSLEAEIGQMLVSLNELNEEAITSYFRNNTKVKDDLLYESFLIMEEWQNVQQVSSAQSTTHLKLIESIRKLFFTTSYLFDIYLNIDTATHALINATNQGIINSLTPIPLILELEEEKEIISPALLEAKRLNIQSSLTDHLTLINDNILVARRQNEWIKEHLNNPSFNQLLFTYNSHVQSLARQITIPFSPEFFFKTAIETVQNGYLLFYALDHEVETILNTQLHTLKTREAFGTGFIIFGVISVLGAYTTRLIRRPLGAIREAAEQFARGDLSVQILPPAKDEVGLISEAFNELVKKIGKIIHNVGEVSSNLAASSNNIFSTAEQLESNVVLQEQAVTHIARNAKGVSRTVQEFALSLQEATQTASKTAHLASLGQKGLVEMEEVMQQIAKASMNIVKTLSDLQEKVHVINDVINTIVKIADQINLLSLNTAIRAGKPNIQHRGFTVLADKINELADQTALATLDIENLVQHIIETGTKAVLFVDQFSDQIRTQVFEATEIGDRLKQLISHTQGQVKIFETVNEGMQKQATRATQIHESISVLTAAAQGTTQSVRNLYLEIEYLHHSTSNLQVMAQQLTQESFEELLTTS